MRILLVTTLALATLTACGLDPVSAGKDSGSIDSTVTFGALSLSSTSLEFGNVPEGEVGYQTLIIGNEGEGDIRILAIDVIDSGAFGLTSTLVETIGAGQEQVLEFGFLPSEEVAYNATMVIQTDAEGADWIEVALSGAGGDAEVVGGDDTGEPDDTGDTDEPDPNASIRLSQSSMSFGTVDIGQNGSATVTIENVGDSSVSLQNWEFTDTTFTWGRDFSLPYILDAGESKTASILYSPVAEVTSTGTATLVTNDPVQSRYNVNVSGEGFQGCTICAPQVDVDANGSSVEMSFYSLFEQPDTQQVFIQNIGDEPLVITDVYATNDIILTAGNFSVSGWSGTVTLDQWDSVSVSVSYVATDLILAELPPGDDYNRLHVISNDPYSSDYIVDLAGGGTGPL